MTEDRIDILKRLLVLSRIHLQLVLEEKWKDWEAVACEKEDLYGRLMTFRGPSVGTEKEIVAIIREVENQALEELTRRRNEVKKELAGIDRLAGGIKNYRQLRHEGSKRHFSVNL